MTVAYCKLRINEHGTPDRLCELIDKMLPSRLLYENEERFEEVCDYIRLVNKTRRAAQAEAWTQEDFQRIFDRVVFLQTAGDMQREAAKGPLTIELITRQIELCDKPGDLITYLNRATENEALKVDKALMRQLLEQAGKHAEAKFQSKAWDAKVADAVQDFVLAFRAGIDPPPQQQEVTQ